MKPFCNIFIQYFCFSSIGADVHARDYAGKKPKDLVKDTVAPDIQSKHFFIYTFIFHNNVIQYIPCTQLLTRILCIMVRILEPYEDCKFLNKIS